MFSIRCNSHVKSCCKFFKSPIATITQGDENVCAFSRGNMGVLLTLPTTNIDSEILS